MVFLPPRRTGLLIGFGALIVLLILDVGFVLVLRSNPLSIPAFLSLLLLAASLPTMVYIAYRTYGLLRSRYVLSRNAVVVEWGARRIVLPMRLLDEARAGADAAAGLRPRGLTWPGNTAGTATVDGLGQVEFLASAEQPGLVLLRHAESWLAISPPDPAAFMAALAAAREQGVEVDVEPESVIPAPEQSALLHDRLALALVAVGALGAVLLLGYLAFIAGQLPPQIALHFDARGVPDRFGPPSGLLILPAIAGLTWLVNTFGGVWLYRAARERPAAYVLFAATLFVQVMVWIATVGLLTAGTPAV